MLITVEELKKHYPIYPKFSVIKENGIEITRTLVRKRNPNEGDKYYLQPFSSDHGENYAENFLKTGTFHVKGSHAYLSGLPLFEDDNQED